MAVRRNCLRGNLRECGKELSVATALAEEKVAGDCEKLFARFLEVYNICV